MDRQIPPPVKTARPTSLRPSVLDWRGYKEVCEDRPARLQGHEAARPRQRATVTPLRGKANLHFIFW